MGLDPDPKVRWKLPQMLKKRLKKSKDTSSTSSRSSSSTTSEGETEIGQEQSAKVSRAGAGRVGGPIDAQYEGVCPSSPRLHVEPGRTKSSTNHVSIHPELHSAEVQRRPTSRSDNSRLCLCGRSPPASSPCRGARRRGATPEELGDDHRRSTMDHQSENRGGTGVTGDNGLPG